ncbi:MAG: L-aspartate oxidase [Xanthomonadaceae bacterium]|nr:L-aspartate oxidase [Xanthomonadaceae bacterium]
MGSSSKRLTTQALILGSGIAGLSVALKLAQSGMQVLVVCKGKIGDGSTAWAQGGIASVWSDTDSFEQHAADTLDAGAGLCNPKTVDICVHEGPQRVQELIDYGVPFTKYKEGDPTENFDLHREGGHRKRRILHADDMTGFAIIQTLSARLKEHQNIRVLENYIGIDLITSAKMKVKSKKLCGEKNRCLGAYVLNTETQEIFTIQSQVTMLATGGAGKVYLYTSNPDSSSGDGIAMAHRAGARIANMEFMQFHPTCLYHPDAKNFLITEALRGEGAVLKTIDGLEFMESYHPMKSLAPRDIVARAIDMEIKRSGSDFVHLDARSLGEVALREKFPNIYERCLKFGINIARDAIPVVPACHYTCGGVWADENARTSIEGLYAIGEVASTGLHGANRLASNSLLEGAVFAHRASVDAIPYITSHPEKHRMPEPLPEWNAGHAVQLEERIDIAATWHEIRTLMWNYVGIVRSDKRLDRARVRLGILREEINQYYWEFLLTADLIELRNLATVADLIVQCASLRKESRGLHYTVDYPEANDLFFKHDTVI